MSPDHLKALFGPGGCIITALAEGEALALRVVGDCMAPDFVNQASVRLERPKFFVPGDVVAFHCPHQDRLLMHRFLGYVRRRGAWKLMTMADRGTRPDPLIDMSNVFGRVSAQSAGAYRITPARRLDSMRRHALWCVRRLLGHD